MSRPEFETVVASAPKESMVFTDLGQTIDLSPSVAQSIIFNAPPGYVAELKGLYLSFPVNELATSGNMSVSFGYSHISLAFGSANYNKVLSWYYSHWYQADFAQLPPSVNQGGLISDIVFDDVEGFKLTITNNENAQYTKACIIRLFYKLRQVAK